MINQARPHIQGKIYSGHRSAALPRLSRAGPSFFFKAMVMVIAALTGLAI